MKKTLIFFALFNFILISCNSQTKYRKPEVDPTILQQNFMNWWTYQSQNIMLSRDYIALDANSQEISKDAFLTELTLGNYIPIKLESNDDTIYYQLFKISPKSDTSIKATIAQSAFDEKNNFEMEGKPFPDFSFKDLDGNLITNESMKGKIVVIKCWYIHCTACVKEFPDVNALVAKYKNRNDIIFVSLAEDTPEQLKTFLAKKPLSYAVVPNMKVYMNETLTLNSFPTHFILDKQGKIVKVVTNYESLAVALTKISSNN